MIMLVAGESAIGTPHMPALAKAYRYRLLWSIESSYYGVRRPWLPPAGRAPRLRAYSCTTYRGTNGQTLILSVLVGFESWNFVVVSSLGQRFHNRWENSYKIPSSSLFFTLVFSPADLGGRSRWAINCWNRLESEALPGVSGKMPLKYPI